MNRSDCLMYLGGFFGATFVTLMFLLLYSSRAELGGLYTLGLVVMFLNGAAAVASVWTSIGVGRSTTTPATGG